MKCRELIDRLEQLAPPSLACEWDNVGLLVGRSDKEVKTILIALDATDEVVEEAIALGADFLLTHHPLIFKPIKQINDKDFIARRVMKLIRHDISYYAMHTNFDIAPGGMADLAADRMKLKQMSPLEPTTFFDGVSCGVGKQGELAEVLTLKELGVMIKHAFGLPFLTVYGEAACTEPISKIAISPGSGNSVISRALEAGVQVLITGDITHHAGIDAAANHMTIIDAGHYGLEHIFIDFMETYLIKEYGNSLELHKTAILFPIHVV